MIKITEWSPLSNYDSKMSNNIWEPQKIYKNQIRIASHYHLEKWLFSRRNDCACIYLMENVHINRTLIVFRQVAITGRGWTFLIYENRMNYELWCWRRQRRRSRPVSSRRLNFVYGRNLMLITSPARLDECSPQELSTIYTLEYNTDFIEQSIELKLLRPLIQ